VHRKNLNKAYRWIWKIERDGTFKHLPWNERKRKFVPNRIDGKQEIWNSYKKYLRKRNIEEEITTLTNYLEQPGMPGINGKLIDNEGFPLPDIDIMEIRKARNRLIILQNDYKNLMSVIESSMQKYFESVNKEKKDNLIENNKPKIELQNKTDPITITVSEDIKEVDIKLKIPFCYVSLVTQESPADEAGLAVGDGILKFDSITYGKYNDPLIKISELIKLKKDIEIPIEIVRKNNEDKNIYMSLKLIPHAWNGQGLLGCKLVLDINK